LDSSEKKYKWPINEEMFNILGHKGNANQNDCDSTSSLSEWQSSRKQANAGEG
jgi:hypothetical protein